MKTMKYTYECTLYNEKNIEEQFDSVIEAPGQSTAKDEIEKELHKEWGYITKRTYRGEQMMNKRYWVLRLKLIEFSNPDLLKENADYENN